MAEHDPFAIDADPATSLPSMSAAELRIANQGYFEGVFDPDDLKVFSGGGLSVDVSAGRAMVRSGSAVAQPGNLYGIYNDATKNSADFEGGGIPANGSANPRLDLVVGRVYDHTWTGDSGQRKWRLHYLAGTPSSGAALGGTLPSFPGTSIFLAEVLVPGSNPTTIPAQNIRDRRRWARRGFARKRRTNTSNVVIGTTRAEIHSDLAIRLECIGVPLRMSLRCFHWNSVASSGGNLVYNIFYPWVDGAALEGSVDVAPEGMPNVANLGRYSHVSHIMTPSVGSHVFSWAAKTTDPSMTIDCGALHIVEASVEELPFEASNG